MADDPTPVVPPSNVENPDTHEEQPPSLCIISKIIRMDLPS